MFFFHLCLVRVLDSMRQSLFCTDSVVAGNGSFVFNSCSIE